MPEALCFQVVCPSIHPSVAQNTFFPPVHESAGPSNQPLLFFCPSVRRGFRAFPGKCMKGMACNLACWCILTTFRIDWILVTVCWFLPEASFGLRVLSSPASVGLCVRVCVCVWQSRACPRDNSSPIQARITKFGPEMQNTLVWVLIVFGDDRPWSSRSNLTWKSNFTSFWACSHHYSSAIQARITKFGPKMHLSTVKIPTNFGLDWLWSSLSFSILKPIFLPNLFAPFLYIFSETRRL